MTRVATALFALLTLAAGIPGYAGSLRVSPTRLELSPDRRAVSLTVTNTGNAPSVVQLDVQRWSQDTGDDAYTAAAELIVSPPVFTLDPGVQQVVRVGRRTQPPRSEQSYRVFVQEVPTLTPARAREMSVVLRIGVPLFLSPANAPEPHLQWSLVCLGASAMRLRVHNEGGRALRVDSLNVEANAEEYREQPFYVLAGATRLLPLRSMTPGIRYVRFRASIAEREVPGSASCE